MKTKVAIVIPNWNGRSRIGACLDSLLTQSEPGQVVVVDNGSRDDSVAYIREKYPSVHLIEHAHNKGFAGGVNAGIRWAIHNGFEFVALLNNDAVAEQDWLKHLLATLDSNPEVGIATPKFLDSNKEHFDSTGDIYTTWGLPYPRGRGEPVSDKYDSQTEIFGASGGASLYRAKMLEDIGLFDEDFFAYYEDVDLSFRAQLAGWKVRYVPTALAYHEVGATSALVKGFTTYQALKNYPWMLWKNVPLSLLPTILPRFLLAYNAVFWSSVAKGRGWPALKGSFVSLVLLPKKLAQRWSIQRRRQVSVPYIRSILTHDLPPNAHKLRKVRGYWRRVFGRATK